LKKKLCLFSLVIFVFSLFLSINLGYAFKDFEDLSTSAVFITDDTTEINFLNNVDSMFKVAVRKT